MITRLRLKLQDVILGEEAGACLRKRKPPARLRQHEWEKSEHLCLLHPTKHSGG
jgi:hypothetical protein